MINNAYLIFKIEAFIWEKPNLKNEKKKIGVFIGRSKRRERKDEVWNGDKEQRRY